MTLLDVLFAPATPTQVVVSTILWLMGAAIVVSYLPRAGRWLTDRDLEQVDDDDLADDIGFLRIVRGEIA